MKNTAFFISCSKLLCEYEQRTKRLALILSTFGAKKSIVLVVDPRACAQQRVSFIVQLSSISKERGVFLCAVQIVEHTLNIDFFSLVDVQYC